MNSSHSYSWESSTFRRPQLHSLTACLRATLCFLSQYFDKPLLTSIGPADYILRLYKRFSCHQPIQPQFAVPKMPSCLISSHFCRPEVVRCDTSISAASPTPNTGLYNVLDRAHKYFIIDCKGHSETVAIDCFKLAFTTAVIPTAHLLFEEFPEYIPPQQKSHKHVSCHESISGKGANRGTQHLRWC